MENTNSYPEDRLVRMTVLILFIIRIHTTKVPFIRPELFQNKQYNLSLAFLASASIYGKVVDRGSESGWNVLNVNETALIYSNIYLILALLILVIVLAYYWQLDGRKVKREPSYSS